MLSPYHRLLDEFSRANVRYVLVGVEGFNQWVPDGQSGLETTDMDMAIADDRRNWEALLGAIARVRAPESGDKFVVVATNSLEAEHIDISSLAKRRRWARWLSLRGWTLVIEMPNWGYHVETVIDVSGFSFEELEEDSVVFDRRTVPMRVAALHKILESKRLAGREKDKAFFKRYANLIDAAIRSAKARARGLKPDLTPREVGRRKPRPK